MKAKKRDSRLARVTLFHPLRRASRGAKGDRRIPVVVDPDVDLLKIGLGEFREWALPSLPTI